MTIDDIEYGNKKGLASPFYHLIRNNRQYRKDRLLLRRISAIISRNYK